MRGSSSARLRCQRGYRVKQFLNTKRLGNVGAGTIDFANAPDLFIIKDGGENGDRWCAFALAQSVEKFPSTHTRHAQIQEDQVDRLVV